MSKRKLFLNCLLISLVGSSALNGAKAPCTDLKIDYAKDPELAENWTADVWYTPCGETKEAAFPYYAGKWKDNHLSIASHTLVRIGIPGRATSFINEKLWGDHVDVLCTGTVGTDLSHENPANCRRVTPLPLHKCTEVIIDYAPDSHWVASMSYTPCGMTEEAEGSFKAYAATNNSVMIESGTKVKIGPLMTLTNFLNEPMSGAKVKVLCTGHHLANANCQVVK